MKSGFSNIYQELDIKKSKILLLICFQNIFMNSMTGKGSRKTKKNEEENKLGNNDLYI